MPSVVLYQYESCPFCNKVRAQLDYSRIPYTVVEVDPLFKAQIAWSAKATAPYAKVPVAVINGERVCDSVVIMDTLDALAARAPPALGLRSARRDDAAERQWRSFVDARVIHLLSPNLYRTFGEALESFDYLTQRNFPAYVSLPAKYVGAVVMTFVARKLKARHMTGDGDERAHLVRALNEFADGALAGGRAFAGGDAPNAADVSLFGILRAIRTLRTFEDVMRADSGCRLRPWYDRMQRAVGASALAHRIGEAPAGMAAPPASA